VISGQEQLLVETREYDKNMAENDMHYWKKVITPLKEKQMILCDVVLKTTVPTTIQQGTDLEGSADVQVI